MPEVGMAGMRRKFVFQDFDCISNQRDLVASYQRSKNLSALKRDRTGKVLGERHREGEAREPFEEVGGEEGRYESRLIREYELVVVIFGRRSFCYSVTAAGVNEAQEAGVIGCNFLRKQGTL